MLLYHSNDYDFLKLNSLLDKSLIKHLIIFYKNNLANFIIIVLLRLRIYIIIIY